MHSSVFISNQGDKGGDQAFTNMGVLLMALFSFPFKETRVRTKLLGGKVSGHHK